MLEHASIGSDNIDRILVGGAFGSSLSPQSLLRTGLLPLIDAERIIALGNSAGQGAKLALRDRKVAPRLQQLVKETEYIELSFVKAFSQIFVKQMHFPATNPAGLQQEDKEEG